MSCVRCTRDTIFMYATVCTERVRTIYTHTHTHFFSPFFFSLATIYRIPVVIVRLSESIEGIARLMMSISRSTGPAAEVSTNRNGCSPGESRDTRTSDKRLNPDREWKRDREESEREREKKRICQLNTT